jgi:hypothetical protein
MNNYSGVNGFNAVVTELYAPALPISANYAKACKE